MPLEIARTTDEVREHLKRVLRSDSADDKLRDHIRVVLGQQPYKHNHFSSDLFFSANAANGAVRNVYGQRVLRVTGNFLQALTATLQREAGESADELLYRCGFQWGAADIRAFVERVQQEYEIEFEKMAMGVMLESWWWPLRASGWGAWRYDFRDARNGLIFIDLDNSMAAAVGRPGRRACHIYAGLFAAAFSHLARRELASIELECTCQGHEHCRFLVTTPKRIRVATTWRDEGIDQKTMAAKLATLSYS